MWIDLYALSHPTTPYLPNIPCQGQNSRLSGDLGQKALSLDRLPHSLTFREFIPKPGLAILRGWEAKDPSPFHLDTS